MHNKNCTVHSSFIKYHNVITAEIIVLHAKRTITFPETRSAFARESRQEDLTRMSSYPVAELQRKLTTTWSDITSMRTCSCWRWATRGSIRTANAIIRARRVILAIRVILPPDTTSLSSNYHRRPRIYRIHPSPIPRMHTCMFTTTVTRESETDKKCLCKCATQAWRGLVHSGWRISNILRWIMTIAESSSEFSRATLKILVWFSRWRACQERSSREIQGAAC